jgi:hypothetical protein
VEGVVSLLLMAACAAKNHRSTGGGDPYWANVAALLHFEGSDGAQTYTDVVGNAWVPAGASNISVLDTSWSAAGGASLLGPNTSASGISTTANIGQVAGDFTVEAYVRVASFVGWTNGVLFQIGSESAGRVALMVNASGELTYNVYGNGNIPVLGVDVRLSVSTDPTHIEFARHNGTLMGFVAGKLVGSVGLSGTLGNTGGISTGIRWNGWIDELRFTDGVARHTADFTPPPPPFPDHA